MQPVHWTTLDKRERARFGLTDSPAQRPAPQPKCCWLCGSDNTYFVPSSVDHVNDKPVLQIQYDYTKSDPWTIWIMGVRKVTRGEDAIETVQVMAESMLQSFVDDFQAMLDGKFEYKWK